MTYTAKTSEDLERAYQLAADKIILKGQVCSAFIYALEQQKRRRTGAVVGGAILAAVGGVVVTMATGGLAAPVAFSSVAGLAATWAGGTVVMTTAELAIVSGLIAATLGVTSWVIKEILDNYNIQIEHNGTRVVLEKK